MSRTQMEQEVGKWRELTAPGPSAVLLTVRTDIRYTPEEYDIYRQIKQLWGSDLTKRLVVAFTFGDRQDQDLEEELKVVCPELKSVLRDASGRYVVFNNKV
nr:hypothetical protein BaRGS_002318 [Batillaria attramentaria]